MTFNLGSNIAGRLYLVYSRGHLSDKATRTKPQANDTKENKECHYIMQCSIDGRKISLHPIKIMLRISGVSSWAQSKSSMRQSSSRPYCR